jgi:putative ABC transport system permease protein
VPFKIYFSYNFIALGLSLFFSTIAVLLALRSILKEIPASGMRPKAPKSTQRSSLERWPWFWTKLSYTQKLITRNILMGKVKILLSSIGIVGSIALLITGLSLRNSASMMINGSINTYKFQYAIKTSQVMGIDELHLPIDSEIIERTKVFAGESEDLSIIIQVIETDERLLAIKDHSGTLIEMKDDTVIITKAMAIVFGLGVGDRVDFLIDDEPYSLIITNVSNQYLNKSITITFNKAELLGLDGSTDKFYVSTPSQEIKQAEVDSLLDESTILAVDTKIKYQETANEVMKMLNSIIMVIVLSALLLSITVIYNLASINIFDRQRELATLRVLGYTVREVENLVYAENYLLTFLGAVGGLPAGIYLFQTIAQLVSSKEFIMSGEISTPIIALSLFAGFFFTFITNRILRRKIVKIKLVESLKAVE